MAQVVFRGGQHAQGWIPEARDCGIASTGLLICQRIERATDGLFARQVLFSI